MRLVITILCGVGLYVSVFMLAKGRRAALQGLDEPSVVQTPRARLIGRIPNAAFGVVYYAFTAGAVWIAAGPALTVLVAAAVVAATMSAVLAYSLLFVTRMPCPYCWTAHIVNACLLVLLIVFVR